MAEIRVAVERQIGAPAERVYRCIADYTRHHHRFLPTAFSDYEVEQGGVGAGTIVRFSVTAVGRKQTYRALIAEPQPGRVLTESDTLSNVVTSFTVTPATEGSAVRIETAWERPGLRGVVERLFAPRLLRPLYDDELTRLDRYTRELVEEA